MANREQAMTDSTATNEVTRTAPERIWLQISDDAYHCDEAFPTPHADLTWCADSVMACEVAYVRADRIAELEAEVALWKARAERRAFPADGQILESYWRKVDAEIAANNNESERP